MKTNVYLATVLGLAFLGHAQAQTIDTTGETDSNNQGTMQVMSSYDLFQTFVAPSGYSKLSTLRFTTVGGTGTGEVQIRVFDTATNTFLPAVYTQTFNPATTSALTFQPNVSLDASKTYAVYWRATGGGSYTLNAIWTPSTFMYADGVLGYVATSSGTVTTDATGDYELYLLFGNDTYIIVKKGPDAANTRLALASSAAAVRSQLNAREAGLTAALGHDSDEFGRNDVSLSFVGRYTALSDAGGEGAGALVAAYRVTQNIRLGAFVDHAPLRDGATGIRQGDAEPTLGGFAVYEQNKDRTGFRARIAAARGHGRITATRDASLADTEAGSGKAGVNAYAVSAEAGYGVRIAPSMVALPYVGLRYTDIDRKGYAETGSDAVTRPLTYADYGQKLTTALGGVRLFAEIGGRISGFVDLGAEYDVKTKMDAYSGTSAITDLETFSVSSDSHRNRLRASASAGFAYRVAAAQSISAQVAVRGQAYAADPAVSTMVKYSVGF